MLSTEAIIVNNYLFFTKMNRLILIILLILPFYSFSKEKAISDGPYIFIEKNKLVEKNIINNKVFSKVLESDSFDTVFIPEKSTFNNINKIAVLSDIHGQYELLNTILKNNNIIDEKENWIFGKGHLVINGDIFDRGNKVNEVLWLVFKLETQAIKKGGRVHYLLGNHEYMVLYNDLRYINEKYKLTSELLNVEYDKLYGKNTIIGRWMRSKSTIIKINNHIFTHGGISENFLAYEEFNIDNINYKMRESIPILKELRKNRKDSKDPSFYNVYFGSESLIWYRGYLTGTLTDIEISKILKAVEADHIIVGHTSNAKVLQFYNFKIIGVDSSIKKGEYGELLIIDNNQFFRGTLSGKLLKLN